MLLSRFISLPAPAAGQNISYDLSLLDGMFIQMLGFKFTASSAVATRSIYLKLRAQGILFTIHYGMPNQVTASGTSDFLYVYNWINKATYDGGVVMPMPLLIANHKSSLIVSADNIDSGDTFSHVFMQAYSSPSPIKAV